MRLTDDEVILLGYDVSKSSSVRCVRRSENKIKSTGRCRVGRIFECI